MTADRSVCLRQHLAAMPRAELTACRPSHQVPLPPPICCLSVCLSVCLSCPAAVAAGAAKVEAAFLPVPPSSRQLAFNTRNLGGSPATRFRRRRLLDPKQLPGNTRYVAAAASPCRLIDSARESLCTAGRGYEFVVDCHGHADTTLPGTPSQI
jgi:hypothetical protein